VLECVEDGHTRTTPDHLRVGDTVNVQNQIRPHRSLGLRPPAPETRTFALVSVLVGPLIFGPH